MMEYTRDDLKARLLESLLAAKANFQRASELLDKGQKDEQKILDLYKHVFELEAQSFVVRLRLEHWNSDYGQRLTELDDDVD